MPTTIDNQVAIIESSVEVFKSGPQILIANKTRADKALAVGNKILSEISASGMTAELDARINNYLANVTKALGEMKVSRAEVTQIMDELKKMFTAIENELDAKKPNTIPARLQAERDQFAKAQFEEAERRRKEAERIAAKQKEAIEFKAQTEIKLFDYFNTYLLCKKQKLQNTFNAIALDEFEVKAAALRAYEPEYSQNHFKDFTTTAPLYLHTKSEMEALIQQCTEGKYHQLNDVYKEQMLDLKQDLLDKLPAKREELYEQKRREEEAAAERERQRIAEEKRQAEIAAASAKQKKILEEQARIEREKEAERMQQLRAVEKAATDERLRREQEEALQIQRDAEEAKRLAEQNAEIKKQGDLTLNLFEQEAAAAEAPAPEARQGYEITVLHPAGFVQLFQYWFENEGKNLPVDKIGNTKLDQMKAFCEKHAHKYDTQIQSKFLKYEASFKAINRKVK